MLFGEDGLAGPSANVITFVLGQLGVVGALVWYLWYQTAKEMPRARQDYLQALNDQRADHTRRLAPFMDRLHSLDRDLHSLVMAQQDLADAIREAMELRRLPRPSRPGALTPGPSTGPDPRTPAAP